jgi:hypothetical protein
LNYLLENHSKIIRRYQQQMVLFIGKKPRRNQDKNKESLEISLLENQREKEKNHI